MPKIRINGQKMSEMLRISKKNGKICGKNVKKWKNFEKKSQITKKPRNLGKKW